MLRRLILVAVPLLLCAAMVSSVSAQGRGQGGRGQGGQGGPGGGGPGGFGGGPGGGTSPVSLAISDPNVQKDLELVDDQVEKLRTISRKMFDGMRDQFTGLRDLSADEREKKMAEIRTAMQDRQVSIQKEVDEVLLPHQRERLKQIAVQASMRNGRTSEGLASKAVAEELGITDAQKEELKKAQDDAEKELREKTEKLRDELKAKVLKVLTSEQRAKLEKLTGPKVEFSQQGFGGRGQGGTGGGPGGRPAGGNPTADEN